MKLPRFMQTTLLCLALSMSMGCAELINQTLNAGLSQAGNVMGKEIGSNVGKAVGKHMSDQVMRLWTPMLMQWYVSYLFNLGFGAGGYVVTDQDYAVGEWTRWGITGVDQTYNEGSFWLERAFLARDNENNEWWKLKVYDAKENKKTIVEALFDQKREKILRIRAQFPDDTMAKEMPVDEHNYYIPPRKLTAQSLKGATVGVEQVRVPAGSYRAKHLRYGDLSHSLWEWWLSSKVPGGLVKYTTRSAKKKEAQPKGSEDMDRYNYTLILIGSGTGATSELGVMP